MKVIIAGGKYFQPTEDHIQLLDQLHSSHKFSEVISGKAKGADRFGEIFAIENKIPIIPFPAKWEDLTIEPCNIKTNMFGKQYNSLAGFNRNEEMAEYGEGVILFSGGDGTNNMRKLAREYNLVVLYDEEIT